MQKMQIAFKAKPQQVYNMDDTPAYRTIKVPDIKRSHVDMDAARSHSRFGSYANSDMFLGMLAPTVRNALDLGKYSSHLILEKLPPGVTVRPMGPLVEVSFYV